MGDCFQTVVDLDAGVEEAKLTAARLREWLIGKEIIVPAITDCVLSSGGGHAPGKNYALAVHAPDPTLLRLRTNGVAFVTEHTVFHVGGAGEVSLVCAACRGQFAPGDTWNAAVDSWYTNSGPGLLACEICGAPAPITDWRHEPPMAFGNVGVEFWSWPLLSDDFVAELGAVAGHRVRLVTGKI